MFYVLCVCSAGLSADGVSAEHALRREDLHAVESSQRDQRGHHAVRGQSNTATVQVVGAGQLQSVKRSCETEWLPVDVVHLCHLLQSSIRALHPVHVCVCWYRCH